MVTTGMPPEITGPMQEHMGPAMAAPGTSVETAGRIRMLAPIEGETDRLRLPLRACRESGPGFQSHVCALVSCQTFSGAAAVSWGDRRRKNQRGIPFLHRHQTDRTGDSRRPDIWPLIFSVPAIGRWSVPRVWVWVCSCGLRGLRNQHAQIVLSPDDDPVDIAGELLD